MRRTFLALAVAGTLIAATRSADAQDPSDVIYAENTFGTFTVTLSAADWTAICNDGTATGDQWKRGTMTWTNGSITETVQGVGIKRAGQYSATIDTPKPSIRISFNEFEFEAQKRKWRGINRIKLDSMIGNTDMAMMRDRLAYWTFRQFGAPASRACHARLIVNGDYKGVFTVEEPVKEPFCAYRWGEDDGNLYSIGYGANQPYLWVGPNPASYVPSKFVPENNYPGGNYSDVVQLVNIVNNYPTNQIASLLNGHINLDAFYSHLACQIMIADGDGIAHWSGGGHVNNHSWYHRAGTNKMEVIKWDPGASQGLYDAANSFPKGQSPMFYRWDGVPLVRWMLTDPTGNAAVKAKISTIVNGSYASNVLPRIDFIYNQIRAAVYQDPYKGISPNAGSPAPLPNGFTNAQFDATKDWLKDWYTRRIAYLRSQVGPTTSNNAQFISQSVPATMTAGQTYSVSVTMKNNGTTTWTDAAYKLGSQNPTDNTTWGMNRVSMVGSVAPGANKTFTWNVTAPTTAGTRNFQWRMNQSGVGFFGDLTPNVAVNVTGGGGSVTKSFQDGVSPTAGYAGTRDTYISQDAPTTNYGTATALSVDGDTTGSGNDLSALLKWDVTAIPAGSTIQSASITFYVTNPSTMTYELYRLGRAWVETGATWNQYAAGSPWQIAGAKGTADRGATVRGAVTATTAGFVTIALNSVGVALVQEWVNTPANNFGLILTDTANVDGLAVASRNATTASQRPKLQVAYSSTAVAAAFETADPELAAEADPFEENTITAAGEADEWGESESSSAACGALGVEWMLGLVLLGIGRRFRRRT